MNWLDEFPNAKSVYTAAVDLNGQARGKRLPASRAAKLTDGSAKMPMSALSLDIFGDDVADSPLVFETGDQDGFLRPADRAPVPMPWLAEAAVLLPMQMYEQNGTPFEADPRHILRRVLDGYAARNWQVMAATELEFFVVDEDANRPLGHRLAAGGDILGLGSLEACAPFLDELYAASEAMNIPAEAATSESGKGQFEVTLSHGPAMKAAEDTWLFKMLVRGLAQKHGMAATFMAKPHDEDAGTGMHMHFSVIDENGTNVFDDGTEHGSTLLKQAVAGCLESMAEATLIFAPHENSFRRLVPGAHAPTAVGWGYENRTASVRIPAGPGKARRIEHRVAGGDTNPFLLFATVLGSALNGIDNAITPPAPVTGNAYDADLPTLAKTWAEAVEVLDKSHSLRRILSPTLVDLFVGQKRQEIARIADLSNDVRLALYFDRV